MADFRCDSPAPVGVARLDEQHRRSHELVSALVQALRTDPGDAGAEERFVELFQDTVLHFKAEEDFLEGKGYPDLIPHRFEHELLLDWFREQLAHRNAPEPRPLLEVVTELADLLRQHREKVDQAYATWLASR
jgi:hemerythrin-like metal-binding protein